MRLLFQQSVTGRLMTATHRAPRRSRTGEVELSAEVNRWHQKILWMVGRLRRVYGLNMHGNLKNPTDELFYVMLSKRTQPDRYRPAFEMLSRRFRPWEKLLTARTRAIATVLHNLGMSAVRAEQFKRIAGRLASDFGEVSLESLRDLDVAAAKAYLTSLPGVGEKIARCVLMYSFGHDLSPMDTHATRVMVRFGLLPKGTSPERSYRIVDTRMPKGLSLPVHVTLISHGRAICKPRRPLCNECPITQKCPRTGV